MMEKENVKNDKQEKTVLKEADLDKVTGGSKFELDQYRMAKKEAEKH